MTKFETQESTEKPINTEIVKSINANITYFSEGEKNDLFTSGSDTIDPVDRLGFFHSITKDQKYPDVRTKETRKMLVDTSLENLQDILSTLNPDTSLNWANKLNENLASFNPPLQAQAALIRLSKENGDIFMDATLAGPIGMVRIGKEGADIFSDTKSFNPTNGTYTRFLGKKENISNENAITSQKQKLKPGETIILLTATDTTILQDFGKRINNRMFEIIGNDFPEEIATFLDTLNYDKNSAENLIERLVNQELFVNQEFKKQTKVQKIVNFLRAVKNLPENKYPDNLKEDTQVMIIEPKK